MCDPDISKRERPELNRSRLIVWMSLRWVIPSELLSSIARFRFAHRSHPKPKPPVRLLKISERKLSQNSAVSREGVSPDTRFAIGWRGEYRIDGDAFVFIDRDSGRVLTIFGYPIHRIAEWG